LFISSEKTGSSEDKNTQTCLILQIIWTSQQSNSFTKRRTPRSNRQGRPRWGRKILPNLFWTPKRSNSYLRGTFENSFISYKSTNFVILAVKNGLPLSKTQTVRCVAANVRKRRKMTFMYLLKMRFR